ncbi:MAG: hypothetical protein PUP91_23535 [Rhizonema sp. PD37]|nr:hypothetical protein [Rhizonema sp. PD37]
MDKNLLAIQEEFEATPILIEFLEYGRKFFNDKWDQKAFDYWIFIALKLYPNRTTSELAQLINHIRRSAFLMSKDNS